MKVTLSEIKKNYKELTVAGMKPRIKSMLWNTRKKNPIRIARIKKNLKKMRRG